MKQLVEFMARSLVDSPDAVHVGVRTGEHGGTVFELKVASGDLGKVIGKKGRTAKAMRTILKAVSSKTENRAMLEILE